MKDKNDTEQLKSIQLNKIYNFMRVFKSVCHKIYKRSGDISTICFKIIIIFKILNK